MHRSSVQFAPSDSFEMSQPDRVICSPSLAQTSVFPEAAGARFAVLLQWNRPPFKQDWELAVWHNSSHNHDWTAMHLKCETADTKPVTHSQLSDHMPPS